MMWTVRYTCSDGEETYEVYCADERNLLAIVFALQDSPRISEFKVGAFGCQCRDGSFQFQGFSKWVERFSHEKGRR